MAKKKKAKKVAGPPKWWPAVRAAILFLLIFFNVLAAFPSPGHVSKSVLERRTNQTELRRWVDILGGFGIQTNKDELAAWYIGFAAEFEAVKRYLTRPVREIMDYTMTSQGWRLFGMPDERPYALKVVARTKGVDRLLYRSGDAEHDWEAAFFQFRRVRGLYNPGANPTATYRGFTKALSKKVFDAMPEVDEVVISVLRTHTTLPGEPKDPSVEERFVERYRRPQ